MSGGFFDLHAHILPGVDDGARTMADALDMAQIAVKSGVHTVVATPHSRRTAEAARFAALVDSGVRVLQHRLRCEGIPLRVLPGMEVFVTESTPSLLQQGLLLPLNGTRYVLMEFALDEDPDFINAMLHAVRELCFVPVIAHPERCFCVQEFPEMAGDWRRSGYVIQVTKGSFLGRFGEPACTAAQRLLRDGVVSVVASDAHTPRVRTTDMSQVARWLTANASLQTAQELLMTNPQRLLADEELPLAVAPQL